MENRSYETSAAGKPFMLSPAEVEFHHRRGRELQADAIANAARRAFQFLTGDAARPAKAADTADVAHSMTSSLAAIRSTAELLRDHPNLDVKERKQFLGRLLEEEQRLERLLPKALQGA